MNTKTIKALVLNGYGINCEVETKEVFERAGCQVKSLHINEVIENKRVLSDTQILALPGGFSYGDHISSGKMFANKIKYTLQEELQKFSEQGKFIIGICNGFQILVKSGLLPDLEKKSEQEVTLITNENNEFINKWAHLKINTTNNSPWLNNLELIGESGLPLPIRHLEGKFYAKTKVLKKIKENNLPALTYLDNPNGSLLDLAGFTNAQGNVFGLMPHPEAFRDKILAPHFLQPILNSQYRKFPRLKPEDGLGMIFFYNVVDYLKTT